MNLYNPEHITSIHYHPESEIGRYQYIVPKPIKVTGFMLYLRNIWYGPGMTEPFITNGYYNTPLKEFNQYVDYCIKNEKVYRKHKLVIIFSNGNEINRYFDTKEDVMLYVEPYKSKLVEL